MTRDEFNQLIAGIFAAHNKPLPREAATLAKWFDRLKEVPMEAAKSIAARIEDAPKLEANLASQFLEGWRSWRAANPERCAHEATTSLRGCRMCSRGWIYVYRPDRLTIHAALCGHCSPFAASSCTAAALETQGYVYVPTETYDDGHTIGNALCTQRYVAQLQRERRGRAAA